MNNPRIKVYENEEFTLFILDEATGESFVIVELESVNTTLLPSDLSSLDFQEMTQREPKDTDIIASLDNVKTTSTNGLERELAALFIELIVTQETTEL
jgi:hypothetical protein